MPNAPLMLLRMFIKNPPVTPVMFKPLPNEDSK